MTTEQPRVEITIEELKRVDIDNTKYSLDVKIYYHEMNEKSLPIILKNGEATYNMRGNSFHLETETENNLDEIGQKYGFDSYDIVEALENRKNTFLLPSLSA